MNTIHVLFGRGGASGTDLSALISTGQRNTSDPMMYKEVGHGKKSELKL